jgi:hypothetical protein
VRHVELTYSERAYARGKAISLIALALTLIWILAGVAFERRRTGTTKIESRG